VRDWRYKNKLKTPARTICRASAGAQVLFYAMFFAPLCPPPLCRDSSQLLAGNKLLKSALAILTISNLMIRPLMKVHPQTVCF
jgi:hypothetical protein